MARIFSIYYKIACHIPLIITLLNDKHGKQIEVLPKSKLKLMGQVRGVLRYHRYAYDYSTEKTYCQWILHNIRYFEL
jgi:hypothetical protein